MKVSSIIIGFIRSQLVPGVVTLIAMFLVSQLGVEIDSVALAVVLMPIFTGSYYLVARWLEATFPWLKALGLSTQPVYDNPVVESPA